MVLVLISPFVFAVELLKQDIAGHIRDCALFEYNKVRGSNW